MFKSFVLLASLAFCAATPAKSFLPKPRLEDQNTRIVGGFVVPISLVPYQVSLQYGGQHICGGSIIADNWILTAAHCTDGSQASQLSIRAGTARRGSGGQVVKVKTLIQNEQYDPVSVDYDYSLLELESPLTLDANKKVVELPEANETLADGTWTLVSGWGDTKNILESSRVLRAVFVPIVNHEECNQALSNFGGISDRMICAGFKEGGRDACQGDSGGPLVANGKLEGVVSWGYGCAEPDSPGVYAKVSEVRDWIAENSGV